MSDKIPEAEKIVIASIMDLVAKLSVVGRTHLALALLLSTRAKPPSKGRGQ